MAASQIDIKIRTLIEGVQGIQALVDQLGALAGRASGVSAGAKGAGEAVKGVGASSEGAAVATSGLSSIVSRLSEQFGNTQKTLSSLRGDLQEAEKGFSSLTTHVKQAGLAFVAFLALRGVKELADYAARSETLGVTLKVVADNAGYTSEEIAVYEKELKKLGITTQSARESMTKMIQAGIPLEAQAGRSASTVSLLARAAQDLAVVTGENSSQTLQRLTTNIQQLDTMGLRFMGITVDVMGAQDKLATSLNTTRDALTQQQKVMAVTTAVLDEAGKLSGAYTASMDSVGKKAASLSRYQEELANSMGEKLLPAYGAIVDSVTSLLIVLGKYAEEADSSGAASKHFGDSVADLSSSFSGVIATVAKFIATYADLVESVASNGVGMISDLMDVVDTLVQAAEASGVWSAALYILGLGMAGLRDGLRVIEAAFLLVGGAVTGVLADILQSMGKLSSAVGMKEFGASLINMASSLREVSNASDEAAGKIIEDFANGRSAVNSFIEGVDRTALSLGRFGGATNITAVNTEIALLASAMANGEAATANFGEASKRTAKDVVALLETGKLNTAQMDALIASAKAAGVVLPEGFSSSSKAAKTLSDETDKLNAAIRDIGKGSSFKAIEAEIITLVKAQRANALSSIEAGNAVLTLSDSIDILAESGSASGEELGILRNKLLAVGNTLNKEFDEALKGTGASMTELTTGVNVKFAEVSAGLTKLASHARTTAEGFSLAFSKGVETSKSVSDLQALSKALTDAKIRGIELKAHGDEEGGDKWLKGVSAASSEVILKFNEVFDTQLKSATSQQDFALLRDAINSVGTAVGASSSWMESNLLKVASAQDRLGEAVLNSGITPALKDMGMTLEELHGEASAGMENVINALDTLAKSAEVSGEEYYRAFSKATDTAKSIEDISGFRDALEKALSSGVIGWGTYTSALQTVEVKFDQLFQTRLKAAKTAEDYNLLRQTVLQLGDAGEISSTAMNAALQKISDKAFGTKDAIKMMNQEALSISKGVGEVLQANNALIASGLGVQKARNDLLKAEGVNARENTAITQLQVELKQAELELALAKEQTEKQTVALKNLELNLQRESIKLEQAQAELERTGSEAARAEVALREQSVELAQRQVAAQQTMVQESKNAEAAVQGSVSSIQTAAAAEEALAESTNDAAAAAAQHEIDLAAIGGILNELYPSTDKLTKKFLDAGISMKEAKIQAQEINASMRGADGEWDQLFIAMDSCWKKAEQVVEAEIKLRKRQEENLKAAENIKVTFDDTAKAAEMMSLGISGWSSSASALNKAMMEIQYSAAKAAKSAEEAVRSFSASATSIHEELLSAMGLEKDAANSRFESRKKELQIQYEQLKVQLQIAQVQAKAAGIDTKELDKAASDAAQSYSQSLGDLEKLQSIANEKAAEQELQDSMSAAGLESSSSDVGTAEEASKTTELADQVAASVKAAMEDFGKDVVDTSGDSVGEAAVSVASSTASSVAAPESSSLKVVEVTKVDISFDGAKATAYTQPGKDDALVSVLKNLRDRAMSI